MYAVAAGGRVLLAGPGEQLEVHVTQPAWLRIHFPDEGAVRAAAWGMDAAAQLRLQCVLHGAWHWERAPRRQELRPAQSTPAQPAPAPPAYVEPGMEGAATGFRGWLRAQAVLRHAGIPEPPPGAGGDAEAELVARHALANHLEVVPASLAARLADWLLGHAAAALSASLRQTLPAGRRKHSGAAGHTIAHITPAAVDDAIRDVGKRLRKTMATQRAAPPTKTQDKQDIE